jgi:hypothetical protein
MSVRTRRASLCCVAGIALALVAGGCGTQTSVTRVWSAPLPAPAMNKVLVFGARMDAAHRRDVEDALVSELRRRGVAASPSYQLFQGDPPERDKARAIVKDAGIDGLLVASLRDAAEKTRYVAGSYHSGSDATYGQFWSSYYGPQWTSWGPGYVVTEPVVRFDTTLWDTRAGDQLVWAATTESSNPSAGKGFARSLTKGVIPSLEKAGHIPKKPKD